MLINPLITAQQGIRQLLGVRAIAVVSIRRQLRQLAELRSATGMGRAEYFKYRVWRPELTPVERLSYTSQRERRLTEAATNRREPATHHRSKSETLVLFASAGLPVPTLVGRVGITAPAAIDSVPIARTAAALAVLLEAQGDGGLVFKPEHGMQGDGILVATAAGAGGVKLLSGDEFSADALWQRLVSHGGESWRIERWVRPHPVLAEFRPGATPTVRLLTLLVDGTAVVHAATLKLPVGDSGVDNLAKGNLVAAVDLATGIVGPATDGSGAPRFDHHPTTGVAITGCRIPDWPRVLAMALAGAPLLTPRRAIGWDIAVTATGPVVIEANASWCEKLMQLPAGRGLTRGAFIRLLHEVGAGGILERRRLASPEWIEFEALALAGDD